MRNKIRESNQIVQWINMTNHINFNNKRILMLMVISKISFLKISRFKKAFS